MTLLFFCYWLSWLFLFNALVWGCKACAHALSMPIKVFTCQSTSFLTALSVRFSWIQRATISVGHIYMHLKMGWGTNSSFQASCKRNKWKPEQQTEKLLERWEEDINADAWNDKRLRWNCWILKAYSKKKRHLKILQPDLHPAHYYWGGNNCAVNGCAASSLNCENI